MARKARVAEKISLARQWKGTNRAPCGATVAVRRKTLWRVQAEQAERLEAGGKKLCRSWERKAFLPPFFRLRTFADVPGCWVGDLFRSATPEGTAFPLFPAGREAVVALRRRACGAVLGTRDKKRAAPRRRRRGAAQRKEEDTVFCKEEDDHCH